MVFNGSGQRESQLTETARALVGSFEALLSRLVETHPGGGPPSGGGSIGTVSASGQLMPSPSPLAVGMLQHRAQLRAAYHQDGGSGGGGPMDAVSSVVTNSSPSSIGSLLITFDQAWVQYLDQFVAWKTEDAQALESELVS